MAKRAEKRERRSIVCSQFSYSKMEAQVNPIRFLSLVTSVRGQIPITETPQQTPEIFPVHEALITRRRTGSQHLARVAQVTLLKRRCVRRLLRPHLRYRRSANRWYSFYAACLFSISGMVPGTARSRGRAHARASA
jgi:hypothetical protein